VNVQDNNHLLISRQRNVKDDSDIVTKSFETALRFKDTNISNLH